jgi:poly-gamma-glutamate synthesis protein (capsule biosynthesis protein)
MGAGGAGGLVRLGAVGDVMLHGRYDKRARAGEAEGVFAPLAAAAAELDVLVGNLETVLAAGGAPRADKLCLRGDPAYARALAAAGFRVLSLANNHTFDYGWPAFAEMRGHLRAAGLRYAGAGADLAEARAPALVEAGGARFAFLAYCDASTGATQFAGEGTPGVAPLDRELVLADLARWREAVDHVVLLLHWGLEYVAHPTPEQVRLAEELLAAGARAVLGHHSHMLQGVQARDGRLVAYSLANLTDAAVDWQGPTRHFQAPLTDVDRESVLLRLAFTPGAVALERTVPLWLDDAGQPVPAEGERRARIQSALAERSDGLDPDALERRWQSQVVERRVLGPLQAWWEDGSLLDKLRRFNLGQIHSAYLLARTYLQVKLSRSAGRWSLVNPRNDRRPMPVGRRKE